MTCKNVHIYNLIIIISVSVMFGLPGGPRLVEGPKTGSRPLDQLVGTI